VDLCFDRRLTFFSAAMCLPYQRLKVGVNHERRFHLLVVVPELHLVFAIFGQLCPRRPFQLPHAFGFVPFQQLRCRVNVQAAFAEMFAAVMPSLVIQQRFQPSHEGIMGFFVVLYQHQVDSREASLFFAEPMHDHALFFPAKHASSQMRFCFSSLFICDAGVGKSIPVKFSPSSVGYLDGLDTLFLSVGGNSGARSAHLKHLLSRFWTLMIAFLFCSFLGSGM